MTSGRRIPAQSYYRIVEDIFNDIGATFTVKGPDQWVVALGGGEKQLSIRVRSYGEFLLLDAFHQDNRWRPPLTGESIWEHLQWNANHPGVARLVIGGSPESLHHRGDIPLVREARAMSERIRCACSSLRSALDPLYNSEEPYAFLDLQQDTREEFLQLCHEAGWSVSERADRLLVKLEVSRGFYEATVLNQQDRVIRVSTELAASRDWTAVRQNATGLFLLSASSHIPMVRGSARENEDDSSAVLFEVVLVVPFGSGELHHGLSALSVACDLVGEEVRLFEDEALAETYLKTRGWSC